jgi:hypothetical protein
MDVRHTENVVSNKLRRGEAYRNNYEEGPRGLFAPRKAETWDLKEVLDAVPFAADEMFHPGEY